MPNIVQHIVQGPDGKNHIINGPDTATPEQLSQALNKFLGAAVQSETKAQPDFVDQYSKTKGNQSAPTIEEPKKDLSLGDTVKDVAKSAGVGLAQGAIGIGTLPFNVANMAANITDYVGGKIGHNPELSQYTENLPTYQNTKNKIKEYTGKFYEPQSRLGEYARTVGEFAPGAGIISGASRAARVANALVPAIVSETAGQLSKGTEYEPVARVTGALMGGMVPTMAMRAITPMKIDPNRAASVRALEDEGVTSLTAGDKTGNKALQWMESVSQDVPFNGGRAASIKDAQSKEFTRAALRRAGINADEATSPVIDDAFNRLSREFSTLTRNNAINVDNQLFTDLRDAWQRYSAETAPSLRAPIVENVIKDVVNAAQNPARNGQFAGTAYATTRKRLAEIERNSRHTRPELANVVRDIRNSLDDAMERSVAPDVANQWRQARDQYRELLAIENAVGKSTQSATSGRITPAALAQSVIRQDKRAFVRGQRDQGELAKAGVEVLKPLPQSGTAPRQNAQNFFNVIGAGLGGSIAGVPGAIAGMVGQAALQGGTARTLMSRPVQNYLSNQAMANAIEQYKNIAPRLSVTVPQAAAIGNSQFVPLRGSQQGMMLDENGNRISR